MEPLDRAAHSFSDDFAGLTGHSPLGWQRRLFSEWLIKGNIPQVCNIPTGLGKTACMAVWLIARARGANLPRRLVYVVDRRAVVDQATRFAEDLASAAADALGIADLPVSTLRGKFADNRRWLQSPAKPAIIVGTIDMIGSRLLFSGYRMSRRMSAYHAGFLGADALIVLDEAHLCTPFESLLRALAEDRDRTFGPLAECDRRIVPALRVMSLSATTRDESFRSHREVVSLSKEDRVEPFVARRLAARKQLRLWPDHDDRTKLVQVLADRACELGARGSAARVLIYCDRRADAIAVKQRIDGFLKSSPGVSELMVGERRVKERERLDDWLRDQGFIGEVSTAEQDTAFLIATSAGEVGVDLDADHMVCDLVAWERMVQRLGRVNRRGQSDAGAYVDVIPVAPPRLSATASERTRRADRDARLKLAAMKEPLRHLPRLVDGRHDASVAAVVELASGFPGLVQAAVTPSPLYPRVTRALVDSWALTSLEDHPGRPDIEPWLRGWEREEPQTSIVWRKLLPWRQGAVQPDRDAVNRFFSIARVHLLEVLEAPTRTVFDLLVRRARGAEKANIAGDVPVAIALDQKADFQRGWLLSDLWRMAELRGTDKVAEEQRLYGATVVVSSVLGGLTEDGMLDSKVSAEPSALDAGWGEIVLENIGYRVISGEDKEPDDAVWKLDTTIPLSDPEATDTGEAKGIRVYVARSAQSGTEGNPEVGRRLQALEDHQLWAEQQARQFAKLLALPCDYATMLAIAAAAHDLGKQRELWQDAMSAPQSGRPYAKTPRGGNWRRLIGYRHEFGSLRDFEAAGRSNSVDRDLQELALHLIAAHHGRGRPEIASFDPTSHPDKAEQRAREVALRFAHLQRRWGPWGLAWWEGLLQAADVAASAQLTEHA